MSMVLAAPFPWFLVAAGGLLPVPIMVMWGLESRSLFLTAVMLLNAGIGIGVFRFASRHFAGAVSRAAPSSRVGVTAGVLGFIAVVSFLSLYGGGENLSSPEGKFANLYSVYSDSIGRLLCRARGGVYSPSGCHRYPRPSRTSAWRRSSVRNPLLEWDVLRVAANLLNGARSWPESLRSNSPLERAAASNRSPVRMPVGGGRSAAVR
jgi:hypothetical protein